MHVVLEWDLYTCYRNGTYTHGIGMGMHVCPTCGIDIHDRQILLWNDHAIHQVTIRIGLHPHLFPKDWENGE